MMTQTCWWCGLDGLPVEVQELGEARFLGWSCPHCQIGGVSGLIPSGTEPIGVMRTTTGWSRPAVVLESGFARWLGQRLVNAGRWWLRRAH